MSFFLSFLRSKRLLSAALFLSVLIIYFPVLGYDFLHFDDQKYVTENPHVLAGMTWASLKWAFSSMEIANWMPLTYLSHMLDVQLFGLRAGAHHGVNVLLHAANSVLLFLIFDRMTLRRMLSLGVACLFAFHPMHVESVAWISERKDMLSTFFIFLATGAYVVSLAGEAKAKSVFGGACGAAGAALFFFVLSLFSKPMYVTFPILLLVLDFWPLERIQSAQDFKQCLIEKWKFAVFSLSMIVLTILAQGSAGAIFSIEELPLTYRLLTAFMSVSAYIQKFFYPEVLSIFYPAFTEHDFKVWGSSTVLVLLGVMIIIAVGFRKRAQWVLAGWLLFLISLLPVLGLIKAGSQSIADRYTYFAYIGLSVILLWTGDAWVRKKPFLKIPLIVVFVVGLGFFIGKTVNRIQDWQSTEKLFQSAVRVHPKNYVAFKVLADDAYHRRDLAKAAHYLEQALLVLPVEAESSRLEYELNLAIVYHQAERFDLAAQAYEKVTGRMPLRPDLMIGLGNVYMSLNQPARARLQYEKALVLLPGNRDLQEKLAGAKQSMGVRQQSA